MVMGRNRLWLAVLVVGVCAGLCWGQARSRHQWSSPRLQGLSVIGGEFGRSSSGLGGLERTSPYGGSGLLRSSIGRSSGLDLRRRSGGGASLTGPTGLKMPTGQSYGVRQGPMPVPGGVRDIPSIYDNVDLSMTAGVGLYLQAVGQTSVLLTLEDEAITSFVPAEPSRFQEHMAAGDKAFRKGKYPEALESFDLALKVGRGVPETHLAMVNTYFAMGRYYIAAQHLREALTYLPELPLVSLDLGGFYGQEKDFDKQLADLRNWLEDRRDEADGWLVLAYVQCFEGADDQAQEALRRSYVLGWRHKQQGNLKAAGTLWEGMVLAGRASGELAAATQPAALLGPASWPVPPTEPAQTRPKASPIQSSPTTPKSTTPTGVEIPGQQGGPPARSP